MGGHHHGPARHVLVSSKEGGTEKRKTRGAAHFVMRRPRRRHGQGRAHTPDTGVRSVSDTLAWVACDERASEAHPIALPLHSLARLTLRAPPSPPFPSQRGRLLQRPPHLPARLPPIPAHLPLHLGHVAPQRLRRRPGLHIHPPLGGRRPDGLRDRGRAVVARPHGESKKRGRDVCKRVGGCVREL